MLLTKRNFMSGFKSAILAIFQILQISTFDELFDIFIWQIWRNLLMNIFTNLVFSVDFSLTQNLLTVLSFWIGVFFNNLQGCIISGSPKILEWPNEKLPKRIYPGYLIIPVLSAWAQKLPKFDQSKGRSAHWW